MPDPLPQIIAGALHERIASGALAEGERLPSETDLAAAHDCSRATVREALKILAARNLIRTRRGAAGGAFVSRLTFEAAVEAHVATSTLLLSMNAVDFETAAEARYALESACCDLACTARTDADLAALASGVAALEAPCDDRAFCAADVAFHRAFADAARNPVLGYHLAGAIEAMQPLMNMITYRLRDRHAMLRHYHALVDAVRRRDADAARASLRAQEAAMVALYHRRLAAPVAPA
ncbi:FadR/GntR family transcriptional regulator [Jannaschia sp. W003]|uniref:FadR/GntR family transcriptional regulator n=1 Tax=Jannaschia sp. W003 TaxID=2867012 RepID=UPI0021A75BEA|nr:FCD domain-containing protein [Jannaschia sp. W003]UWQ20533.1 FCD domain-containing protein [Jannaschia sp. W003]